VSFQKNDLPRQSFADHDPKEAPANFLGTPVLRQAQSAASLLRLGLANSKNSARSPWYLAPGRLTCHPLMMAFPDESTTRHSHLDRPRPLTITTSSIIEGVYIWILQVLGFGPLASAVRIVGMGQENADTQKGKQPGHDLGHCRLPPRLAMPTTAVFKNSR
jgi:hypothetical protein